MSRHAPSACTRPPPVGPAAAPGGRPLSNRRTGAARRRVASADRAATATLAGEADLVTNPPERTMKGMVFTEFLEMVEARWSPDLVDDLVD
ncbi:MAG: hypothetical protein O9972_44780, partial [Burkholderiales bacterium]|nr:hypothetical protein [Burkholderiales bacterium]